MSEKRVRQKSDEVYLKEMRCLKEKGVKILKQTNKNNVILRRADSCKRKDYDRRQKN